MSEEVRTEGITDITIVGAGPSGLFTAFEAGMHELSARVIESLPEPGGQLTALYPEKYIFDVPGFPKITARELAENLYTQAAQFDAEWRFNETVLDLKEVPNPEEKGPGFLYEVITDKAKYLTRSVIIAAGLGAFKPRTIGISEVENLVGKGIAYSVRNKDELKGLDIVIVGGGDSAIDWTLNLVDIAGSITLVHRRDTFRAHPRMVSDMLELVKAGRVQLFTSYEVSRVHGSDKLEGLTIRGKDGKEVYLKADRLFLLIGFVSDLGPIGKWGLEIEDNRIKVGLTMESNRKGIFAVGDIANYPGKLKLILTGFSDAAQAVRNALIHIKPGEKVRHVHSTSLKIFRKQD